MSDLNLIGAAKDLANELAEAQAKLAAIDALVRRTKDHFMVHGNVASMAAFLVANELDRILHPKENDA